MNTYDSVQLLTFLKNQKCFSHSRGDRLQQLEQQYARLKSLNTDRHEKLEELVVLTEFRRSMDELERWIREKEQIASNEETGNCSNSNSHKLNTNHHRHENGGDNDFDGEMGVLLCRDKATWC